MTSGMLYIVGQAATSGAGAASGAGGGGDGTYLAWAVALLGIALALFIIEMFVPSGGLLALFSTAALIGGIVLMFWEDTTFGLIALIAVLLAVPFALGVAIKIMPSTPFIRAITLGDPDPEDAEDDPDAADAGRGTPPAGPHDHPLVGKTGRAVTDLRPVGTVLIDGKREECLAQGGMIPAGTTVLVVAVDGMQIKVRRG